MFRNRDQSFQKSQLGWGLLLVGAVFLLVSGMILASRPSPLSFEEKPDLSSSLVEVHPERIKISSLRVDLPVYQVRLEGDQWPLFEDGASYLVGSGQVGQRGNVVIYGHNKKHLLGPLSQVREGDLIEIEDSEGSAWFYRVETTRVVFPDQVEVLTSKDYPALTVYTCTGFLDRQRLVVIGRLR